MIESGAAFLDGHGIDQPRRNAEILLAYLLKKSLHHIYVYWDETVSAELAGAYFRMLRKRAVCVPVQYITGEADFFGRVFFVKRGVLIPRPETEILVEKTLNLYREYFNPERIRILDVGTGCGNIAVTLALEIKGSSVVATEVSSSALNVASRNAASHDAEDRITFKRRSLFPSGEDRFHMIVSNPPYVPHGDIPFLDEEVRKEPLRALDGGDSGTDVIEKILRRAYSFLHAGGFLVMEIGYGQSEYIRNFRCGINLVSIEKDLAGIERVAVFRR